MKTQKMDNKKPARKRRKVVVTTTHGYDQSDIIRAFGFKEGKPSVEIMELLSRSHTYDKTVGRDVVLFHMCKHILEWVLRKIGTPRDQKVLLVVSKLGRDDRAGSQEEYNASKLAEFTPTMKTLGARQRALFRFLKIHLALPFAPGYPKLVEAYEYTEYLCGQWKDKHRLRDLLQAMDLLVKDEEGADGKHFKNACRNIILVMEAWARSNEEAGLSIVQSLLFGSKKEFVENAVNTDLLAEGKIAENPVDVRSIASITSDLTNLRSLARYSVAYAMTEMRDIHENDMQRLAETISLRPLTPDETRTLEYRTANAPEPLTLYRERYQHAGVPALLSRLNKVARNYEKVWAAEQKQQ